MTADPLRHWEAWKAWPGTLSRHQRSLLAEAVDHALSCPRFHLDDADRRSLRRSLAEIFGDNRELPLR